MHWLTRVWCHESVLMPRGLPTPLRLRGGSTFRRGLETDTLSERKRGFSGYCYSRH